MSIPNDLSMRRPPKKRRWYIITLLVAVISAGLYYQFAYLPGQTSALQDEEPSMQSAVVRRGDLVIRATGSGELIATTQLDVGFDVNARVESINVSVGDRVEDGQVLAALDDSQLQADWQDAQRKYTEFTSPLAVLEAQQNIFDLEESIRISRNYLAYLISPEVLYWEERLEESLETLEAAQLATQETGSDEANQAVADLNKTISFQEANLHATYEDYLDIYVPETFTEEECEGEGRDRVCVDVIKPPGETTIRVARNELSVNQEKLVEAQHYLVAITEERIPEGATGGNIVAFENALLGLQAAQEDLAAAQLVAPISGTVLSLNFVVGETTSNSSSITLADLSNPILQIYLDEADWDKVMLGYDAEIIFDALPDRMFSGTVVQIDPFLTSQSGASMIGALVALDNDNSFVFSALPIGVSAAVDIIGVRTIDALLVPVEALREVTPGQYGVFVLEDGVPKLRMVEIGIRDLFYAEVISGLSPGEQVTTGIVETQ